MMKNNFCKKILCVEILLPFLSLTLSGCTSGSTSGSTKVKLFTSIELSKTYLWINKGETYTFTYRGYGQGEEVVMLKTSTPDIISIGDYGVVTALNVGEGSAYAEGEYSGVKSPECKIICSNIKEIELPMTLNNYSNPAYILTETATITEAQFKFGTQTSSDMSVSLEYNLKLEKTYCFKSASGAFKVNYKIYDNEGTVVGSGTITSPSFNVGETTIASGKNYFTNFKCSSLKASEYTIVLNGVCW